MTIPDSLRALRSAAVDASEAYHAHKYEGDPSDADAMIAFDMEEKRLLQASARAKLAYEAALTGFMAEGAA